MDSFDEWLESNTLPQLHEDGDAAYTKDDMRLAFKAGQQLPSEPTEAMLEAALDATLIYYVRPCPPNEYNSAVWQAMLEARDD